MADIQSANNPRVKAAARLRNGRDRRKQRRFLIDGVREIMRAVEAGVPFQEVFFAETERPSADQLEVLDGLRSRDVPVYSVAPKVFRKLAYGQREEGVVALAEALPRTLDDLPCPESAARPPLIVVLERVEKPGNLGAAFRTADAAGATALIVADPSTDLFNPNTIRASLGAVFTVPACCASARETHDWLLAHQVAPFAARVDAAKLYSEVDYTGPSALVLGSEAEGLSDIWTGETVTPVLVPMAGRVDSLNVSVTAAVLLYEAVRQRRVV